MSSADRRRALKRREQKPKQLGEVLRTLHKASLAPRVEAEIEGKTMKALCKRLANRSVLVGKTHFTFDEKGICDVKPNGRSSLQTDFLQLLKMNGVSEVVEEKVKAKAPEVKEEVPAPAIEEKPGPVAPEKSLEAELAEATFAPEMFDQLEDAPVEEEKEDTSKSKGKRGKKRTKKENE